MSLPVINMKRKHRLCKAFSFQNENFETICQAKWENYSVACASSPRMEDLTPGLWEGAETREVNLWEHLQIDSEPDGLDIGNSGRTGKGSGCRFIYLCLRHLRKQSQLKALEHPLRQYPTSHRYDRENKADEKLSILRMRDITLIYSLFSFD